MKIFNNKYLTLAVMFVTALQFTLVSCKDKDELGEGSDSYYTSSKEYASDFLRNRSEYSMFVQVLERATGPKNNLKLMDLLGTYGSLTVFAPTNDVVSTYLQQNGVSSVDELPKDMCDTLALNSIIEQAYFTTDQSTGQYSQTNMLDRDMGISSDTLRVNGQPVYDAYGNVQYGLYINNSAVITHADDSVANGVVHTVGSVVSTSSDMLPDIIAKDANCRIFSFLLQKTKVANRMYNYLDRTYTVGLDSIDYTNPSLVVPTAVEYDNVAYPEHRYFKYTAFVPTDDVFKNKYGITPEDPNLLEELTQIAHDRYDDVYPADAANGDITDPRNALNRMVAYHCLNRLGTYYTLTGEDGMQLAANWDRTQWDIADWYETLMPHSILKCSFPDGGKSTVGLYLNRRGVKAGADYYGVYKRGAKVTNPDNYQTNHQALNGYYHYIDDVIFYDRETQSEVLNERIRLDATTLSPDFMNQGGRGHQPKGRKYGTLDNNKNIDNKMQCVGFKPGYTEYFDFDKNTHLHVRARVPSFWSYQGDEVTVLGAFDLKVKIPPVPSGMYEIRFFTAIEFNTRGIVQAYFGEKMPDGSVKYEACDIPFDMRWSAVELFGWRDDKVKEKGVINEEDLSFDKQIHNLGWMKGPLSYYSATSEDGGTKGTAFRYNRHTVRKVITQKYLDGEKDYYIRFQQKRDPGDNCALNFDFIELCPVSIYNSPSYPEDRY